MERELVDWFRLEDDGDMPELHLTGLTTDEVLGCFDEIVAHGPRWTNQQFRIESEDADFTVDERPDVAQLVADGRAGYACIGATGITVGGVTLPKLSWFMLPDEFEFYWDPGTYWTEERVTAFFVLLKRLLAIAPGARLLADPRYTPDARARYDALVRRALESL